MTATSSHILPRHHLSVTEIDQLENRLYEHNRRATGRDDGKGLALWEEAFYAAMVRNAAHVSDILRLPRDGVVEIGRQIAI